MEKSTMRKIEETSWLAQDLADRLEIEDRPSLRAFKYAVNCADNVDNGWGMRYENDSRTNHRLLIIPSIPYGMQPDFLGLAERYKDSSGQYTVTVYVTHDLNSAVINVSRLMDAIRLGI